MKLSEVKTQLTQLTGVNFELPDGTMVPEHFHVTEIGVVTKHFIDCGGTVRDEKVASFQLWNANDTDHRLKAEKLLKIIDLSEKVLGLEDLEVEVEYQDTTIGKYALGFNGTHFMLEAKQTACLASDKCGTENTTKPRIKLSQLTVTENASNACCTPGGGCC